MEANEKKIARFHDFVTWVFYASIGYFGYDLTSKVREMASSITILNTQMAVILEQVTSQKEINKDHEHRIRILERGK